jgi:hypothetical protein
VRGVIVDTQLAGHPYARLHLLGKEDLDLLVDAAARYEYVHAYSFADLGQLDGFSKERKWSQLITLGDSPETTFGGFHKKVRQEVRKATRDDHVAVIVDDQAREEAYSFYRAMKEADGVTPDIEEDFEAVRWVNGYYRGELASLSSWYDSGETLRAHHSVTTRKLSGIDTSLVGRLTRRLSWEACVLGYEEGRRFIDLAGVDPDDPIKAGITSFKRGFGGETVPVHVYRRATDRWAEAVQAAAERGRVIP